jgi:hypothetical protein
LKSGATVPPTPPPAQCNIKGEEQMKAIDVIRTALTFADGGVMQLLEDMRDAALTAPTPRGGNHPHWILGHLTFVEGSVPHILFGEPNPVAQLAVQFAPGTEPRSDGAGYPPFDELLRTYRDLRARNLQILEQLGDAGLDRPTVAPPKGLEPFLRTAADTFLVVAIHQMNHRGQLADARRAAGRKAIFTPGG